MPAEDAALLQIALFIPLQIQELQKPLFFPRAFSAAVPAFRLLRCVFVLAFVIADFSQYCTSHWSSMYWYEVTLFWIYAQLVRSAFCFCFISITKPKRYQKTVRIQKTCNYRSCIILEIMKNLIGSDQ